MLLASAARSYGHESRIQLFCGSFLRLVVPDIRCHGGSRRCRRKTGTFNRHMPQNSRGGGAKSVPTPGFAAAMDDVTRVHERPPGGEAAR